MKSDGFHPAQGWLRLVAAVFLTAAALSIYFVWLSEEYRQAHRRADVSVLAAAHANAIQLNIERALSATYALAALVRQSKGEIPDFEAVAAQMLPLYQGAASLQLAPGGVVSRIVPLAGNELAIGHDLLKDPERDSEAIRARDTGELTLAGPFNLVQGGFAAVGRLPVYLESEAGPRRFWGFVSVLMRFPEMLASANLPELMTHGYEYQLWRIDPKTGKRQVIAASGAKPPQEPIEQTIRVPNALWTLSVAPRQGWRANQFLVEKGFLGILISAMLAALASAWVKLEKQQAELETRVRQRTRELAESERKLLNILEGVEAYIYIKDTHYRYVFANRPVRELFGVPMTEIVGAEDSRFFDADTAARLHEMDRRVIEHGETVRAEEANSLDSGGAPLTVWSVKLPLRDEGGRIYALCGISTDITERQELQRQAQQTLRESEARFRSLFESVDHVSVQGYDREHRAIFWNRASEVLYGYPREEALGKTHEELVVPPALREEAGKALDRWVKHGLPIPAGERTMQRKNGSAVPVYSSHTLHANSRGEPELYCIDIDLTDKYEADARMRESLIVFNSSSQGILTTDAGGAIKTINPAFSTITGYSGEEVIGRQPSMFKSGRHDAAFYQSLWQTLSELGHWEGEIWNRRKNGEIYPQWLSISAVRDAQGRINEYVGLFSDITERKQQEEVIWRQANFDALTGLANRNLLVDRLERAMAQARRNETRVGLIFLDLDGFKWINDTLGHDVGDKLLVEVANRLKACVRDRDTAARLGGDEFTAVIHDLASAEDMLVIGDKVVNVLREPFILGGTPHQISGSVGITIYPDDGEDVQTLLKNADIAMYKAKQAGKNRCQFYARHMQVDAQARMQLEVDLRTAIAQGEFGLHYQPIIDADSGELVGAEALIRWEHPERGLISPLDFVPVAEDCGLIVPIGEWVLKEAARQWQAWRSGGFPSLRMSVNVSGVQFREASLNGLVAGILEEYRIEPGCLMLEITESVLMDGSKEAEDRMHQIKALGVGYSLDDFGTGFSSLSYLKRFPIDIVKIDRSFVNDCPDDRNDAHLVAAIINMAHSLDLRVTAEGVETEEQREFLRDLGCDYLQGYLVGRPLPAAGFEILMERRRLLVPADGATLEEGRFLAALRQDDLDVDDWLRRLLGERSPELLAYAAEQAWTSHGLDLKHAIQAHLEWRRRLDDFVGAGTRGGPIDVEHAGSPDHCTLGRWISAQQNRDQPVYLKLDRVHREFHRLAGQIVADCARAQIDLARRTVTGMRFRKASRDVVVALIDCYQSAAEAEGPSP